MHIEYERRFIVQSLNNVPGLNKYEGHELIVQGYLAERGGATLRIRRRLGMQGYPGMLLYQAPTVLEYKGARHAGARLEHQWTVDSEEQATHLMRLARGVVQKRRYSVSTESGLAEVDEFMFQNEGLIIAEFETVEGLSSMQMPGWCFCEITDDSQFDNEQLALNPINWWDSARRAQFNL